MPQSAGSKGAHSANDHRIESVRSASSPSITSGNAARPVHPPSRVGPNKASSRAIPRNTPRASAVESSGQSSSSVAVQQQSDYKRPRSTSQHSMSPSQASGPSRTVPRNSKHPDLARASQVPLLDSSSFIEPCDPSMVGVNRLSTILDVTDGEEAHALLDQPQRHAEDDPHWLNGQQGGDWEFLVQENRKQRNVGKGDGTFVLVSRPGTDKGGRGPAEPPTVSSGPPKRFPPAPGIIVRTPGSLARSKDLPSLPSPSIEGSQRWGVMDVGNGVAVAPDNEYVLASPKPGHSKGKSSDSVVTAIHFSQLRSPYMRPLPSSSIGLHTSSTATSQSVPQSALRVSKRSSAISARGSIPKPEQLIQIVSRGHGSAGARNQQFAGNKTTSTLSTAQQDELIGIGNAVCPRCGRQFSTKAVLDQHSKHIIFPPFPPMLMTCCIFHSSEARWTMPSAIAAAGSRICWRRPRGMISVMSSSPVLLLHFFTRYVSIPACHTLAESSTISPSSDRSYTTILPKKSELCSNTSFSWLYGRGSGPPDLFDK